jgi:hypothetical protein
MANEIKKKERQSRCKQSSLLLEHSRKPFKTKALDIKMELA